MVTLFKPRSTSEKWQKLKPDIKQELLNQDISFLTKLLENNTNLKVLLLNGRTTLETVKKSLELNFNVVEQSLICETKQGDKISKIFQGLYNEKIKVIGWTAYIQNLRCINSQSLKNEISQKVKELISQ